MICYGGSSDMVAFFMAPNSIRMTDGEETTVATPEEETVVVPPTEEEAAPAPAPETAA